MIQSYNDERSTKFMVTRSSCKCATFAFAARVVRQNRGVI